MHFPRFSAENSAELCILGGKARREDAEKCRERDLRSHRRSDAQRRDAHFIVHRRSCEQESQTRVSPRQADEVPHLPAGVPGDCESCGEPTALGAACTPPSAPRRSRRGAPRRWTAQGLGRTCGGRTRWRVRRACSEQLHHLAAVLERPQAASGVPPPGEEPPPPRHHRRPAAAAARGARPRL